MHIYTHTCWGRYPLILASTANFLSMEHFYDSTTIKYDGERLYKYEYIIYDLLRVEDVFKPDDEVNRIE